MSTLEETRLYFQGDHFAMENGAVITEIGDGYALCQMEITPRHTNAMGNVMGGAIFTLADFAFAVAANLGDCPTVSTTSQITFLRGAKGKTLTAKAERVREGRTSVYYEISVTDDTGILVARVTASGQILR